MLNASSCTIHNTEILFTRKVRKLVFAPTMCIVRTWYFRIECKLLCVGVYLHSLGKTVFGNVRFDRMVLFSTTKENTFLKLWLISPASVGYGIDI